MALSTDQYGYLIDPLVPITDATGTTIKDGFLRVYIAGSSTPVITYRNYDGATNEQTIELDNSGRCKYPVIVSKSLAYKVVVYDAQHSQETPIITVDKMFAIGASVTAGAGSTIVQGLDNVEGESDGFVKASVTGTTANVKLDATNVSHELTGDAAVGYAANAGYMVPALSNDPDDPGDPQKLPLAWIWANKSTQVVLTPADFLGAGLSNDEWAAAVAAISGGKTAVVKWTESGASRVAVSSLYEAGVGLVFVAEYGGFVTEYVVASAPGAHAVTTNVYDHNGDTFEEVNDLMEASDFNADDELLVVSPNSTRKMLWTTLANKVLGFIKSLATTITDFRTGDVIPVDGPSGTAKMSKDDLLKETAQNAAASGLVATKLEFTDLDEQINGNNGVIASGLFSANDTLFVSSDVSEGDNVVITLKNGEGCQVRFLDSASNIIKSKSLNSETTTFETTIPSDFDKAIVIWNNNPLNIEIVDKNKIADGLKDDVQNNASNISSLTTKVTSVENNLFGYDGIVADASFSPNDTVFTKDSFSDSETVSIKVTLDEGDGCTIRFLSSSETIQKSKGFTEDDSVWETTIPSDFDKAVVFWNNNPIHILVVNESRKTLSVQARLDEKIDYDDVYLVEGEKQKRFYSISQGVSQDDEDNGTSKYDSVAKNNTSWEVSKNTAGVFYNLMKSGKEYSPIFSQMFFYNYRKENEWQLVGGQIVPKALEDVDLDDTMQYIDNGKRPLLYAVDAYDCLPNGWYSGERQQKRMASLIAIVKKAWQQYKAIPVMSWHLENPYTPHAFGTINDNGANYRNNQNITLSDRTIFPYPNTHYDVMGEILNHTSYDDGAEISDDGHWLPSTTSTKCGKGNYFGSDLTGYSAPYLWFEDKMQDLADLINEFVDENGDGIPVILRLFHEPEDRWSWWGNPIYSSVSTYVSFMQYTITELRTKFLKKNVLFGFCMDIYWADENEYIKRYPGDDYIDVVGFDDYTIGTSPDSIAGVTHRMRVVSRFANDRLKIGALFETGNRTTYQKEHNMLNDYLYKSLTENGVKLGICELWSSFVINTTLIENDYTKFMKRNDIRTYNTGDNISVIDG